MVKHIVFFKLKDNLDRKDSITKEIVNQLYSLKDKIKEIKFYELGINFAQKDNAFDIALVSHFDTKEDLEKYRNHPLHKQVVSNIKEYISHTAVVDYEIS